MGNRWRSKCYSKKWVSAGLAVVCCGLIGKAGLAEDTDRQAVRCAAQYDPVRLYSQRDPGEPFQQKLPLPKQYWKAPEWGWLFNAPKYAESAAGKLPAAAKPTLREQKAGMICYITDDPGDYKPWRRPTAAEQTPALAAFLAQGQYEGIWFGIFGLKELQDVNVTVELHSAPVSVEVRYLHCWPQRPTYKSHTWYVTPEMLLPCRDGKRTIPVSRGVLAETAFTLAPEESAAFWLTLKADDHARPGRYAGTVFVGSKGNPALSLPLQLEVLPFRLQTPTAQSWMIYPDKSRWSKMSDAQILADMRDMVRHGMTGLVEVPLGKLDIDELKKGRIKFDTTPFRKIVTLARQAGINGPFVVNPGLPREGWMLPFETWKVLGMTGDPLKDEWPESVKEGMRKIAAGAVRSVADLNCEWYLYAADEPTEKNRYGIQMYQCWHQGGAKTFSTILHPEFLKVAARDIDAKCYIANHVAKPDAPAIKKRDKELWFYGVGCYTGDESGMIHNRYGAGYLFWLNGATRKVVWTFCRPRGDMFNDFDGGNINAEEPKDHCLVYAHLLRPDDWSSWQENIPTIAWESIRAGVNDYLYLYTLDRLIAAAKASPSAVVRRDGLVAQEKLRRLGAAIPWDVPWSVRMSPSQMQQVRRQVADIATRLVRTMNP